ncbi:MAG: NfeD family protein [Erysipelotrichaceae bacterium]|nr:NfeD family protein [Erysipelotrichaceae bacterium]
MFYFWLVLIILLGFIEAITVNLVSIWFIISGLLALILSFLTDNFIFQFGVFVIIGILLMLTTRKSLEKKLVKKEKTNLDRIIGMKGVVTEKIDELTIGEVKVDGKHWSATSKEPLEKGEVVKILKINGVKVDVKRWEE